MGLFVVESGGDYNISPGFFNDRAAETIIAIVKDGGLAGGDSLINPSEVDEEAIVLDRLDGAGLQMRAVADFGGELTGTRRAGDPMSVGNGEFLAAVINV